jgi:diguanylate cyclase (GGDEF) domain
MSIKKSLRILLIMSSMIPLFLLTGVAHGLLTNKLIAENKQKLQGIAESNINGLKAMIDTQKAEVSLLALQDELVDAAVLYDQKAIPAPASVNTLLAKRCGIYEECERISLYNAGSEVIASSNVEMIGSKAKGDLTLNRIITNGSITVGGLHAFLSGGRTIYTIEIGSPILNPSTNNIIGYVISTIKTSYFKAFLSSIKIGSSGYAILLDNNGNIIYHPTESFIGQKINSGKLTQLADHNQNDLTGTSGEFEYHSDHTQQICGYAILPDLNWVLLTNQNISEISSVTTIMLQLLSGTCFIILITVIITANFLAKKYTTPIITLRDAMRTASEGNLTAQSYIKNKNELGELSKSFNKMLHIIRTNYKDLETMHEEIQAKEDQLRSNYEHIEFLAYHDTLTNLPNKLAFLNHINTLLLSSTPEKNLHAVYFVDLDNFKTVNDTLGHEYGDILLTKTAQLLTALLSSRGIVARAGGDEFLLFYENIPSKKAAVQFASQILDCFRYPLRLDGEVVYVSMSIGISVYPENGLTSNVLIKNSDIAMYKSKDGGKNTFTLFDSRMEEELNRNTVIIEVLHNALENKEVYIQYQPQFDLSTNSIIGYEALMRIKSERLGNLSPKEFIPIAEESGLIIELSAWLIREACRFNKSLIDQGGPPRHVSVNVSSIQINRPGFVTMLSDILMETELPPQYLELEITESTLFSSLMDASMLLCNLQNLGVRISLDDFGTGYSSLNYLTKMPINTLKIDKSFIDNICSSSKDAFIAKSIIQLAHNLDIRVVAEGVEQEEQLILLRKQKCDIIQGYIYSPPVDPEALMNLIQEEDLVSQCPLH